MTAAANWLRQTRRTYFGNAAAQRDYRVQLRGNRSMLLFGFYLAILIIVGFFKYGSIAGDASMSVVQAQRELREFYILIISLLAGMVAIVTPGLAATAIVSEKQRRSLDLVFSAPVAPRYYLVGKIIAVYRYIWMLLILSLPVTAACVVLGGASWSDVLTVYFLLSIHGLLFAAIGLMMSTIASKPVAAIIWTYAAVGTFLAMSGGASAASYAMRFARMGGGGGEVPFLIGINPFSAIFTVGTYTVIGPWHVPNFILAALAILLIVRLCLLGAGSLLSEGRETANLRIYWAVVTAAVAFALAYWLAASGGLSSMVSLPPGPTRPADPAAVALGYGLFWMLSPLILALPTLAAYGNDGYQRQRNNGWFSVRNVFDGSPAGALPYLLLLIVGCTAAGLAGAVAGGGHLPTFWFAGYIVFTLGYWALFWAIARVASSYGIGLRAARTVVVAAFVVLVILPVPFLSAIAAESFGEERMSVWNLYLLRPVVQSRDLSMLQPMLYGAGLLVVALALNAWSERKRA